MTDAEAPRTCWLCGRASDQPFCARSFGDCGWYVRPDGSPGQDTPTPAGDARESDAAFGRQLVAATNDIVREYLDGYEMREPDHTPTDEERILLEDFGEGLLSHICDTLARRAIAPASPAHDASLVSAEELDTIDARARAAETQKNWFRSKAWNGGDSNDAAHIAGLDPQTVLRLTARLRFLEAIVATPTRASDDEVERVAELFHERYEHHAQRLGWASQVSCHVAFADLPEANRATMMAASADVLAAIPDRDPAGRVRGLMEAAEIGQLVADEAEKERLAARRHEILMHDPEAHGYALWHKQGCDRVVKAIRAAASSVPRDAGREDGRPVDYGPGRCEVCGWPLAESPEKGCFPGDCSYRPHDGTPEAARIARRRTPWRVGRNFFGKACLIFNEEGHEIGSFYSAANAATAVADHNAVGAEPVAPPMCACACGRYLDQCVAPHCDRLDPRAAPIAARQEPAGEVEWLVGAVRELLPIAEEYDVPEDHWVARKVAEIRRDFDARAALARRPEGAWRDIASAPKDGAKFLAVTTSGRGVGYDPSEPYWCRWASFSDPVRQHFVRRHGDHPSYVCWPTHYLDIELPAMPDAATPENREMLKRLAGTPGDDAGGGR